MSRTMRLARRARRSSSGRRDTPGGARHYRELLGLPHARAMLGWSLLGRLPLGMTPLALLFLIRGEGRGYAAAGIVVARLRRGSRCRRADRGTPGSTDRARPRCYGSGRSRTPFLGHRRHARRAGRGDRPGRRSSGPGAASRTRRSGRRCASSGRGSPPMSCARPHTRSRRRCRRSSSSAGRCSPPRSQRSSRAAGPPAPALASLVGATATALLPPVREMPPSRAGGAGLLGALGSPGVRTVVLYAATVGVGFGSVELAMPAFAEAHGSRELGGLALASFAAGSLRRRPRRRHASSARRGPPLRRRRARARRRPARPPARRLAADARVLAFVAGLPIAPDDRPRSTSRSTAPRAPERLPRRSPGSARPSRSASRRVGAPPACSSRSAASAGRSPRGGRRLRGALLGWARRGRSADCFQSRASVYLPRSARSSGDRAADF